MIQKSERDDSKTMQSELERKARITALLEEVESIHVANRLYWQESAPGREANAAYQKRQDRLEEIRDELSRL